MYVHNAYISTEPSEGAPNLLPSPPVIATVQEPPRLILLPELKDPFCGLWGSGLGGEGSKGVEV